MKAGVADILHELVLLAAENAPMEAARLLGAAEVMRDTVGSPSPLDESSASVVADLTTSLGAAAFDAARVEGRELTPEEAVSAAFGGKGRG